MILPFLAVCCCRRRRCCCCYLQHLMTDGPFSLQALLLLLLLSCCILLLLPASTASKIPAAAAADRGLLLDLVLPGCEKVVVLVWFTSDIQLDQGVLVSRTCRQYTGSTQAVHR
jgi:hypothetical protein